MIAIFSPDDEKLFSSGDNFSNSNYRNYVTEKILGLLQRNKYINIKSIEDVRNIHLDDQEYWEIFNINFNLENGIFAKALPRLGKLATMITILSGWFVTYMALTIANSNNDKKNSVASNIFSISATTLSSIIALILYIYSDATHMLEIIGRDIDNKLIEKCSHHQESIMEIDIGDNNSNAEPTISLKRSLLLLSILSLSANAIILSVTRYQECVLLTDKYLDLYFPINDDKRKIYMNIIIWAAINIPILAGFYTRLAFDGSFANKLIKDMSRRKQELPSGNLRSGCSQLNQGMFFSFLRPSYYYQPRASEDQRHLLNEESSLYSRLTG